jgi:hypothetical protein
MTVIVIKLTLCARFLRGEIQTSKLGFLLLTAMLKKKAALADRP